MALNHIQITNAKPRDKAYKVADSDGLYLVVQTNGAKLWRMNYRHLGRQKTLYFGAWPEVGIAAARQQRDKAREQIAAGLDPAAEKRIETLARKVAADNTFKTIAEEWVAKNEREGRAPITLDKIRWLLGMAYPMIGTLPISKITPQEVLAVLRKVEATGRYESASPPVLKIRIEGVQKSRGYSFLKVLIKAVPYPIHTILTDNGAQFVDRYQGVSHTWVGHIFGRICQSNGIEHRLTKPYQPWTNGQAERMVRTIKEATTKSFHYASIQELRRHVADWLIAYNFAKQLKALKFRTPYEAIDQLWQSKPDVFIVRPSHHMLGPNT